MKANQGEFYRRCAIIRNMNPYDEYLKATRLCDFDKSPEITATAQKLKQNASNKQQAFNCVYQFVKEMPYMLEDWDVQASETLRKGGGMCSGKSNLLVAMCRTLLIPARYRIFKIKSEGMLWHWITEQDSRLAAEIGDPLQENDHVIVEVYLDTWQVYDPSRDTALEEGLKKLGIPLERQQVTPPDEMLILTSMDEWAAKRQAKRRFRANRESVFAAMNEQFDRIRLLGKNSSR